MAPSVSVVVPVGFDDPQRARVWEWLRRRYELLFPTWELIEAAGELPWPKPKAVNDGLKVASGQVVIVADADVVAGEGPLRAAVDLAGDRWVVPFRTVYRLDGPSTDTVLEGELSVEPAPVAGGLDRAVYKGVPGGGIVVARRAVWEGIGGFDVRFEAWGGEDRALACALRACVGPPARLDGPLWHLWHPPAPGFDATGKLPATNSKLLRRYRRALSDPCTMRELLVERIGDDAMACGCGGKTNARLGFAGNTPAEAKCMTCGVSFLKYEDAQAHKATTGGHAIQGLRAMRSRERRAASTVDTDDFAPA